MNTGLFRFRRPYFAWIEVSGFFLRHRRKKGIRVMEREWDTLLVLDACRFDAFEEINWFEGELEKVRSQATETPQWMKRNFTGEYDDVVYVSGNPYASDLANEGYFDAEEHFHHVEHVWDHGWDEDLNTVPPENVSKAVRDVKEEFPDKRIIAHYMQPHEPFIGEVEVPVDTEGRKGTWRKWTHPKIREEYQDNLRVVLEDVEELLDELDGKTVITADHGEILGEKYGFIRHPKDVFLKELYEVPWFTVDPTAS